MLEHSTRDQIKKKIWAEELRNKLALIWILLATFAGILLFVWLWMSGSVVTATMFVVIVIVSVITLACHAVVFTHETTMKTLELSLKAEEYNEQTKKLWLEDE